MTVSYSRYVAKSVGQWVGLSLNLSVSGSVCRWIDLSMTDWPNNRLTNRLNDWQTDRPTNWPTGILAHFIHSVCQWAWGLVCRLVGLSVGLSVCQSVCWLFCQLVCRLVFQLAGLSVGLLFSLSVDWFVYRWIIWFMCQSEGCSFSGSVGQLVCKTIGLPVSLLKGLGRFPKVSLNLILDFQSNF